MDDGERTGRETAAEPARERLRGGPAPVRQWVGFLLPPAVFFAHLEIGYLLAQWACAARAFGWVHVAGVAAVITAAAGTVVAFGVWKLASSRAADMGLPEDAGGAIARTRFLGMTGAWMGAILVLLLVMQTVAGFVISPCQ